MSEVFGSFYLHLQLVCRRTLPLQRAILMTILVSDDLGGIFLMDFYSSSVSLKLRGV
jgi:hypothetical protein